MDDTKEALKELKEFIDKVNENTGKDLYKDTKEMIEKTLSESENNNTSENNDN